MVVNVCMVGNTFCITQSSTKLLLRPTKSQIKIETSGKVLKKITSHCNSTLFRCCNNSTYHISVF